MGHSHTPIRTTASLAGTRGTRPGAQGHGRGEGGSRRWGRGQDCRGRFQCPWLAPDPEFGTRMADHDLALPLCGLRLNRALEPPPRPPPVDTPPSSPRGAVSCGFMDAPPSPLPPPGPLPSPPHSGCTSLLVNRWPPTPLIYLRHVAGVGGPRCNVSLSMHPPWPQRLATLDVWVLGAWPSRRRSLGQPGSKALSLHTGPPQGHSPSPWQPPPRSWPRSRSCLTLRRGPGAWALRGQEGKQLGPGCRGAWGGASSLGLPMPGRQMMSSEPSDKPFQAPRETRSDWDCVEVTDGAGTASGTGGPLSWLFVD